LKIEHDCPHCKKGIGIDTEKMEITELTKLSENVTATSTQVLEQPKEKIVEKEVVKTVSPSDEPFFACANGNCGEGVHRNENYKTKPNKKCKNCDSLSGKKKCKNCGNTDEEEFEELNDEELTELGIPMPPEETHEGHDHG